MSIFTIRAKTDDADKWALAGLLHDIDIAATAGNLSLHGAVGGQILRDLGFSEAVVHAVNAHDDHAGMARISRLDHSLYCADQVYWLIIDTGLSFPSDRLKTAVPDTIWQQVQAMPGKANTLGKTTNECAEIGLSMPHAFEVALMGLRKVSLAFDTR